MTACHTRESGYPVKAPTKSLDSKRGEAEIFRLERLTQGAIVAALAFAALAFGALEFAGPASAASGAAYCAARGAPRASVAVPPELEARVAKAFNLPADLVRDTGFVRCVGRKLLACVIGANLNCGKANLSRSLPGAREFCRANPNADDIPMAATGHDTIYAWRCVGGRAVAAKAIVAVDAQGYDAGNWKVIGR